MDFKLMKQNKRCEYNTRNSSINKKIKEAVDANAEAMTMEVSSHGLALGRLRGVELTLLSFKFDSRSFRLSWNYGSLWTC